MFFIILYHGKGLIEALGTENSLLTFSTRREAKRYAERNCLVSYKIFKY